MRKMVFLPSPIDVIRDISQSINPDSSFDVFSSENASKWRDDEEKARSPHLLTFFWSLVH